MLYGDANPIGTETLRFQWDFFGKMYRNRYKEISQILRYLACHTIMKVIKLNYITVKIPQ